MLSRMLHRIRHQVCLRRTVFVAALVAVVAGDLQAQNDVPPTIVAARLADDRRGVIEVDGILNEPAWQAAMPITGLRQIEPLEGALATERTDVRVLYDASTLYVGVEAHDAEPDAVVARILRRDRVMQVTSAGLVFAGDDAVAILIDGFHDHRNAVVFATNPNGAEFDAHVTDEGREINTDWRAIWHVRARRTPTGWSAEFAIPFRSLRFGSGADAQTWGFNVFRVIRRKNEEVLWSAWSRANEGFSRVSRAGHLENLVDLPHEGMNAEVKPYVLTASRQDEATLATGGGDFGVDVGADVKWEVHPGLSLDLTVNTDFAQVEADDERVNLSRYSLFFPEKRDFFLENAGVFEFGTRGAFEPPPYLMFFSRRIGIRDDASVPVIGGARLTGRLGGQALGFMNVVTDQVSDQAVESFSVARVKRDILGSGFLGAMAVDRRSREGWDAAGGIDWSVWPRRDLNVQGFASRSGNSSGAGDYAYRIAVDYQTSLVGAEAEHLYIGPQATADAGFITRTDIRRWNGNVRLTTRPDFAGLRKLEFEGQLFVVTRTDWAMQDWQPAYAVTSEWDSGEKIILYYAHGETQVDESFDLTDEVRVPSGRYDVRFFFWWARTSPARPVALTVFGRIQRFYGGSLVSASGEATIAPTHHLSLTARFARNTVNVPGGAFKADVGSLRASYAFSKQLFTSLLVQYNSVDRVLTANLRVNFIHRPGSDLFLVLNELRGSRASIWDLESRTAAAKLTYLLRF